MEQSPIREADSWSASQDISLESKVHPRTGHERLEGKCRYSSTLSLASAIDGVGGQRRTPASLPQGKTRYPSYKRLGGPQDRSGRVGQISPPPVLDPRTAQPVASRCTDWAIPTHKDISLISWNAVLHCLVLDRPWLSLSSIMSTSFSPSCFLTELVYGFSNSWSTNVTIWSLLNFAAVCLVPELWTRCLFCSYRRESAARQNDFYCRVFRADRNGIIACLCLALCFVLPPAI